MYIGYGNTSGGRTRIFGEGSTTGHFWPDSSGNLFRSDGVAYIHSSNVGNYIVPQTNYTTAINATGYTWIRIPYASGDSFNSGQSPVEFYVTRSIYDNSSTPYGGPTAKFVIQSMEWHNGQQMGTIQYGERGDSASLGAANWITHAKVTNMSGGGYWVYMRLRTGTAAGVTYMFRRSLVGGQGLNLASIEATTDPGGAATIYYGFNLISAGTEARFYRDGNVVLDAGTYGGYSTFTGTVTATNFSGPGTSLTGTASSLTAGSANAIADGVVSTTAKIANSVVTYAKIQNVTAYTVLGNSSPSAAQAPVEISMATLAGMVGSQYTTSIGNTYPDRVFMSTDANIKYAPLATAKAHLGLSSKYNNSRPAHTADTNYWTGAMGWGTTDWNSAFDWGSGFADSWGGPANNPGDTSHHLAVQAVHYTNGSGRYGWQMVNGAGTNRWWLRDVWGGAFSPWREVIHSGNYTSYAPNINGGSTIAGITYFSNGESIQAYGIRGRFTNEYLHLYNKVGVGNPNGWGQGEGSTPDKGLSTYGGINVAYGNNAASTFNGAVNVTGALTQNGNQVLHTGNYTSYAFGLSTNNAVSGSNTYTNTNLFKNAVGSTVYLGSANTPPLQAYSSDGGPAFMSFHRGGSYAVNMGLDPDNVLRIGGWSAAANRWQLDMSGNNTIPGTMTATSFSGAGTGLTGTAASLSIGGSAGSVAASGITGQTGMWTSAARPGPYRLYRRDVNDGYSVQNYWTGTYWRLDGYFSNDTVHAGCSVAYADTAGSVSTIADGAVSTTAKLANSVVTYAKIQNVGSSSVLGNTSASVSQAPQEITFSNLGAYINGVARAWVTFNENPSTGAITINASLGISSVTRINYGQYRVNFSTAFADANYAVSGTIGYESNGGYLYGGFLNIPRVATPKTTTYCEVTASYGDGNTYNARFVHVVFDR